MTEKLSLEELDSEDATVLISADGGARDADAGPLDAEAPEATIEVPDDATEAELDAIGSALRTYLRTHPTETGEDDDDRPWAMAGRLRRAGVRDQRHIGDTSSDPWVAAGRTSR